MQTRSTRIKSIFTVALIFVLSASVFADVIRLKDGGVIKGRITSFDGGKFVVIMGDGKRRKEVWLMADEVESIVFEQVVPSTTPNNTATNRVPEPAPNSNARYNPPPVTTQPRAIPKVITSDTTKASPPVRTESAQPKPRNEPVATTRSPASGGKPIEIAVSVLADNTSNGWTNSGWVVKKGQKIRVTGDGEISLGGGRKTGPGGSYDIDDTSKLLKSVPTGALIAVIGDDNNDFIYIGGSREFTATRDGSLFLGVNEGNLNDNSGKFSVKIEIDPGS